LELDVGVIDVCVLSGEHVAAAVSAVTVGTLKVIGKL